MSVCMYLVCPWFFLVIYLGFLMLDVWKRTVQSVRVRYRADAASRSIPGVVVGRRCRSVCVGGVGGARRASWHAGGWRAASTALPALVLCGAGAAGTGSQVSGPSRSLPTRRARGRAARPRWARPRRRCAASLPTQPRRPCCCPGSSQTSALMTRPCSQSTASLKISLGKCRSYSLWHWWRRRNAEFCHGVVKTSIDMSWDMKIGSSENFSRRVSFL